MPAFYAKERSKYGNLSGQVIIWPMEYSGDPSSAVNRAKLPAGYLKCDGANLILLIYSGWVGYFTFGRVHQFLEFVDNFALYCLTNGLCDKVQNIS